MSDSASNPTETVPGNLMESLEDIEYTGRKHNPRTALIVGGIAALWSLYQLWIASPFPYLVPFEIISGVPARAIHLAFGLVLVFLVFPASRKSRADQIPISDLLLSAIGGFCTLYLFFAWGPMALRPGILLDVDIAGFMVPIEVIIGWAGILLLLEATRRGIGWPLVTVATLFILYSIFGQSMPDLISHKGVSPSRLAGYQWFTGEAIFGIPIKVTTEMVFLFVLFGAILDKAGAGQYFLNLAFTMVGRYRGGPAKAAILASGMTGLISGSSIANVVTTGTFTIPVMKRIGIPATKAGAIEVAASVNGQIMPPIMGAAAFIIAEFVGIPYFDVVVAAFIPAIICYIALLYISHLEAMKLGLRGLPREEIPPFVSTLMSGIHFLIPIFILIYLLMVEKKTPSLAVFYSIMTLMAIILIQKQIYAYRTGDQTPGEAVKGALGDIYQGLVGGARNMITIAVAVATAGIIVGAVGSTGLNNALVAVVETVSGGNVFILLFMVSLLCLLLGMGLPTTANYVVVATLLANVVVEVGTASGLVLPLLAVHLYVFYFGLMADVTPPVALAAFAASAISRADPIRTGFQAFFYEIRTALLPIVFIFNPELLLIGVNSIWHGVMIFVVSLIAMLCFSSMTQNFMLVRNRWYEGVLLGVILVGLFRPAIYMDQVFPAFVPLDMERYVAGEVTGNPGYDVRFHVTQETDYGERFRLYRVPTPELGAAGEYGLYGVKLEKDGDDYYVEDLSRDSIAADAGLQVGDLVRGIDVEQPQRPPKYLVYPFMLALLGLVILLQYPRWKRWRAEEAASSASAA